jgi:hypothetical protein
MMSRENSQACMKGSFAFEQRVVSLSLVSFLDIARRTLSIIGRFPSDPHRGLSSAFDIVRIHTGDMARPHVTGNGLNRALVVTNLCQQRLNHAGLGESTIAFRGGATCWASSANNAQRCRQRRFRREAQASRPVRLLFRRRPSYFVRVVSHGRLPCPIFLPR